MAKKAPKKGKDDFYDRMLKSLFDGLDEFERVVKTKGGTEKFLKQTEPGKRRRKKAGRD